MIIITSEDTTNEVIETFQNGGTAEAKKAVDAAIDAFRSRSTYSADEQSDIIRKWHDYYADLEKTFKRDQLWNRL